MKHNCFQFGLRSDVGASFESAVQESQNVDTYEEVSEVLIPRMGDMRVKGWKYGWNSATSVEKLQKCQFKVDVTV